ncbi:MAG: hypothetical protein IH594_18040 [Bacteroidales bacterium]|nr:hypothetical protein [Bacteroidales bacterium]
MKKIHYIISFLYLNLFLLVGVSGQAPGNKADILQRLKGDINYSSESRVQLDPFIEDNYYRHLIYNEKNGGVIGYRIRIFSMSGHDAFEKANKTRATFLSKFENIPSYVTYDTPDYKVYVGDCRTRSEVLKLFNLVKKDFPYAFLVSQPINIDTENKR